MSEYIPSWIQKQKDGYEEFPNDKKLLAELAPLGENDKGF